MGGKDRQADIIFHFHQELPKLLRGYHQCTNEEAAILAALIYRVKHAESKVDIAGVLKSLLPSDLLKKMSSYEWKKEIVRAYNKDSGMSPDEAKVAFLKVIYRWPSTSRGSTLSSPRGRKSWPLCPSPTSCTGPARRPPSASPSGTPPPSPSSPSRPRWPTRWTTCSPPTSPSSLLARTTRRRLLFESQRKFRLFPA